MERRLVLGPSGTFSLDTVVGAVTVTGDSASGAVVTMTSQRDDVQGRYDVRFDERAGAVSVTVERKWSWLTEVFSGGWLWGDAVQFTIHVPRQTSVTVKTSGGSVEVNDLAGHARVRSSGGGLRAQGVDGTVEAQTSGGPIRLRRIGGNVRADTSGGGIEIAEVKGTVRAETSGGGIEILQAAGDVYADTSGGGIRVDAAEGRVDARSSGGPVSVSFAAGNSRGGDLSSSGGSVRAEIDPRVAVSIDASSSGGRVSSEVPVGGRDERSRRSMRGDINGGGALLRLRSSGGGVRITGLPSGSASLR
jgi:DUF4097 and DUF4098 domain-containing protein YvlB